MMIDALYGCEVIGMIEKQHSLSKLLTMVQFIYLRMKSDVSIEL